MKQERATYVECDQCQSLFKAGTFKDGSTPTACPTCRVGVDPAGQSVTIETESRTKATVAVSGSAARRVCVVH